MQSERLALVNGVEYFGLVFPVHKVVGSIVEDGHALVDLCGFVVVDSSELAQS